MARRIVKKRIDNDSFDELKEIVINQKQAQKLSESSISQYEFTIRILKSYFKSKDAFRLTHKDAEQFVLYLLEEHEYYIDRFSHRKKRVGLSARTVNTYIKKYKAIYNLLIDINKVEINPFQKIKYVKEYQEKIKTVDKEDIQTILKNLDKNYYTDLRSYALILFLLDTMCRISEALNLTYDDIDLNNQTAYFNRTKNGKYRIANFSDYTKRVLNEYIDANSDFECEYVFTTVNGTKLAAEDFRKQLRLYNTKFNINKDFSCHTFRHTGATMFLENGGSIRVLQEILGHSRITTTEIYSHVNQDFIKKQHTMYNAVNSLSSSKKSKASLRISKRR